MRRTTKAAPEGGFQSKNRRRPTLPGPRGPSTIGAERLNGSVRNGKRCFPLAIATEFCETGAPRAASRPPERLENCTEATKEIKKQRQALDPLVPVGLGDHSLCTAGLSTWWSTRGLTPSRGWESSSRGRLPA